MQTINSLGVQEAKSTFMLHTIEEAIEDIKAGKVIIVVDDEDRENEGDFICAAECITPAIINFMATHGRGLICVPIDEHRASELDLRPMVSENTALHETAFTVSVDLLGEGVGTGISALDRANCIRKLVDPHAKSNDFARPGHIFPLRAKTGGVLRRTGHTEAAIDLARLAGFYPAGVLVEILNEDGTMARLPELMLIASRFDLKIISINDLVAYRMRTERIVSKEIEVNLQTKFGEFKVIAFTQLTTGDVHLALVKGSWNPGDVVLTRVHSTTETGDILGVLLDDYGDQVGASLQRIANEGTGVLLYMRHSEKPSNILARLAAYKDNDNNFDFVKSEQRDFGVGAQILRDLGVTRLRLLTHHPKKRVGITGYGLEIVDHVDLTEE